MDQWNRSYKLILILREISRGQQGVMPGLRAQFENVHPQAPSMEQDQEMTRKCIDSLFKELFDETINEDQFVHNVKLMKTSNRQKEFRMLMKTLLSEFRNYSTFPNLQVERIAKVWGKILCEDILDGTDQFLSHFLKRVIDALQQGMQGEERLSLFGETALQRFILGKPELEARKMLKSKPIYHDFCKRIVDGEFTIFLTTKF